MPVKFDSCPKLRTCVVGSRVIHTAYRGTEKPPASSAVEVSMLPLKTEARVVVDDAQIFTDQLCSYLAVRGGSIIIEYTAISVLFERDSVVLDIQNGSVVIRVEGHGILHRLGIQALANFHLSEFLPRDHGKIEQTEDLNELIEKFVTVPGNRRLGAEAPTRMTNVVSSQHACGSISMVSQIYSQLKSSPLSNSRVLPFDNDR